MIITIHHEHVIARLLRMRGIGVWCVYQQRSKQMTRIEALSVAKNNFNALNTANFAFWMGKGQEPVEADYNYRHGWIHIFGHAFRSDELGDGAPQPYMD